MTDTERAKAAIEVLKWIDANYDSVDMSHVAFRVEAARRARCALEGRPYVEADWGDDQDGRPQ